MNVVQMSEFCGSSLARCSREGLDCGFRAGWTSDAPYRSKNLPSFAAMTLNFVRSAATRWIFLSFTLAVGCGSGPLGAGPKTVGERETALVHEPCNGESSGARTIDVNGDGKPDIIHVMDGGHEACRILDLNLDGA